MANERKIEVLSTDLVFEQFQNFIQTLNASKALNSVIAQFIQLEHYQKTKPFSAYSILKQPKKNCHILLFAIKTHVSLKHTYLMAAKKL